MKEVAVKFGINKIHKLKIQMECQQENIHAHTKNLEVIHLAVKSFVECYIFVPSFFLLKFLPAAMKSSSPLFLLLLWLT